MTLKDMKSKYGQTITMGISLILIIAFFIPWFSINPDFQMFASSDMKISGFSILKGIHFAAPTVSLLGEAYGFPLASKLIYLGYIIVLFPIVGIAAIVMSGLRKPKAELVHMIHYCATAVFLTLFFILILINKDVRELFFAVMKVGFGSILSLLLAIVGIAFYFIKVK